MHKSTPGPWTMETVRTSVGVCFKVGPFPWKDGKLNHACIYADYPSNKDHAECEANAVLIAAAPDMLAALIVAREFISTDRNSLADASVFPDGSMEKDDADAVADYDRALVQIDAAIAKATGSAA